MQDALAKPISCKYRIGHDPGFKAPDLVLVTSIIVPTLALSVSLSQGGSINALAILLATAFFV